MLILFLYIKIARFVFIARCVSRYRLCLQCSVLDSQTFTKFQNSAKLSLKIIFTVFMGHFNSFFKIVKFLFFLFFFRAKHLKKFQCFNVLSCFFHVYFPIFAAFFIHILIFLLNKIFLSFLLSFFSFLLSFFSFFVASNDEGSCFFFLLASRAIHARYT